MAFTAYGADSALNTGDIVGNEGRRYGLKLVGYVYIGEISEYKWITQEVTIKDNVVTPTLDGKQINVYSGKYLSDNWTKRWTKDVDLFKKGDVLSAKDGNGNRILFLFESKDKVHRLMPASSFFSQVSWASLKGYEDSFTDFKLVTSGDGDSFSSITA